MKQLSIYCTIGLSLLILLFSCKKENLQNKNNGIIGARDAGGSSSGTDVSAVLYTEDVMEAGTIKITNDLTNLSVVFNTVDGVTLTQTDLFAGAETAVPKSSTCLALPANFPYRTTHSGGVTTYTYTIPVGSLYNIGGCGIVAAHGVVKYTDSTGTVVSKDVWSAGAPICPSNWASSTPYCLAGYAPYVPQPCPISFKRNNGQGTCGGDAQIRTSFHDSPDELPILDSVYYEGAKINGLTFTLPDASLWATKGYVSYCVHGGNLPPAKKLVLYYSYSNHQMCSVAE